MAIEATPPSRDMENRKDAFFLGGLASIDPIFTQYPKVSRVCDAVTLQIKTAKA